jgi:hypothetical protein
LATMVMNVTTFAVFFLWKPALLHCVARYACFVLQ